MVVYVLGFASAWLLFFWLFGRKPWMWMCVVLTLGVVPPSARADITGPVCFVNSDNLQPSFIGTFFSYTTYASWTPYLQGFITNGDHPYAPSAMCSLRDYGKYYFGGGILFDGSTLKEAGRWTCRWDKGADFVRIEDYTGDVYHVFLAGEGQVQLRGATGSLTGDYVVAKRFLWDGNATGKQVHTLVSRTRSVTDFDGIWLINVKDDGNVPTSQPTSQPTTQPVDDPIDPPPPGGAGPGDGEKHWVTAVDELLRGSSTNGDNVKPGALDYAMSVDGRASTLSNDLDRFKLDSTVGTDATVASDFYSVLVAWGLQEPSFSGPNGDLGGTLFGAWTQGRELNGGVVGNAGFLGLIQTVVRGWITFRNQWSPLMVVVRTFFTGVIVWGFMVSVYRCFCWALSAGTGGAVAALDVEE